MILLLAHLSNHHYVKVQPNSFVVRRLSLDLCKLINSLLFSYFHFGAWAYVISKTLPRFIILRIDFLLILFVSSILESMQCYRFVLKSQNKSPFILIFSFFCFFSCTNLNNANTSRSILFFFHQYFVLWLIVLARFTSFCAVYLQRWCAVINIKLNSNENRFTMASLGCLVGDDQFAYIQNMFSLIR